ncbi:type II toxin-antitoxin system death-on-curing family toxin [Candidatus Riflebacteria bacterium]
MKFINKRMLLVINRMCITITGGIQQQGNNIREGMNLGFVEKIHCNELFGQPIFPDIFHQAAAYMFYIIKNHVFTDGNKRTGLATAITFLYWNGILFKPFDEDMVFDFVINVAEGKNDPDEIVPLIAQWFKELSLKPVLT